VRSKAGVTEARLSNTSQVSVYGNVQITSQALRALVERSIPLTFFSYGGWFLGRAVGHDSKNIQLRVAQHRSAADPELCLRLARGFVSAKIRNARTLLRRNHETIDASVLFELEQLARKSENAPALESLLGIEGTAARTYFGAFTGMLKGGASETHAFDLEGRNRRPPKDPINALLSYTYSLLTKDLATTLGTVGLDPLLGFYHQPRFGRPALALDLMEEFRPLICDSVVVGALNTGTIDASDFIVRAAGVTLIPAGRRKLLLAYERRMDQLVTHPVFGYRISYRRVLEVQARLLGRVLMGELDAYPSFRTR
jgi:CRISPR-associated protein Cas1